MFGFQPCIFTKNVGPEQTCGPYNYETTVTGSTSSPEFTLSSSILNDILILIVCQSDFSVTLTTPSGWTLIFSELLAGSGGRGPLYIYKKTSSGSEPATVTISGDGATVFGSICYTLGCYTTAYEVSTGSSGSDEYPDATDPGSATGDVYQLVTFAWAGSSSTVSSWPSGYNTGQVDLNIISNDLSVAAAWKLTTASEDPGAATLTNTADWVAGSAAFTQ